MLTNGTAEPEILLQPSPPPAPGPNYSELVSMQFFRENSQFIIFPFSYDSEANLLFIKVEQKRIMQLTKHS